MGGLLAILGRRVAVACFVTAMFVTGVRAQDGETIRVESNEVVVPVRVAHRGRIGLPLSQAESDCFYANRQMLAKLLPSEPYVYRDCDDRYYRGLMRTDFRILEDGQERKVQNVTVGVFQRLFVRDNLGRYDEYSETPRGRWSIDLPMPFTPNGIREPVYYVAFVPAKSEEGSCHQIKVEVKRRWAAVFARSEYCNVPHAPSDPLGGTGFGKVLAGYGTSERSPAIDVFAQTGVFLTDRGSTRLEISLELPWDKFSRDWREGTLRASVGLLGTAARPDGTIVQRFSDFACCSSAEFKIWVLERMDQASLPYQYETQIDLEPGEYTLELVIGDAVNFGRVVRKISVEAPDEKQPTISSVFLCKRKRYANVAAVEEAAANFAPAYRPLVSHGVRFTPAGDTRFRKGEPLFVYFEIYEPLLPSSPSTTLTWRMRVVDEKSGEVKIDTGSRSAASQIKPGTSTIAIAEEVDVQKLPAGPYRVDVQAADSQGRETLWRTAMFNVE